MKCRVAAVKSLPIHKQHHSAGSIFVLFCIIKPMVEIIPEKTEEVVSIGYTLVALAILSQLMFDIKENIQ